MSRSTTILSFFFKFNPNLPVFRDHVHPRGGADLHQRVWYKDDVHSVKNARENRVPEASFPLEVKHAHHVLALGVVASDRQHATMGQH